jgi:macrolide transport system ATP-binding/permease protein
VIRGPGRRLGGRRGEPQTAQDSRLVEPSTIRGADLASEVVASLFARPARTGLTVLGTVIGLTALVATLGLSRTASNQIVGRFDALAASEVVVTARPPGLNTQSNDIPWDAPQRLARLRGVVAAGNVSTVDVGDSHVRTSPIADPQQQTDIRLSVQAASPELFDAIRAAVRSGRLFDGGHSARNDAVAVLGPNAADRLGITSVDRLPAIAVGDDLFLVIGILDSVARRHDLLSAVLIPEGTARRLFRLNAPEAVIVETRIGATRLIARQAPVALRPDNPNGLRVASPPEQQRIRNAIQGDLYLLFLMLGGISLLVGAIGIANVTLVSVIERTGEIGLRRAIGATRFHIALQFLLESSALGLVGGIIGASVGTLIIVGVSAYQSWTPVLDPAAPLAAPVIGALIGLLAGAYPALRAARLEPVEALRSAT